MSRFLSRKYQFHVQPAILMSLLTRPEFLAKRHKLQGALYALVSETHRSEQSLIQLVSLTEYPRTLNGVDTSRTIDASAIYEWDLRENQCHWHYHGPYGEFVEIAGSLQVSSQNDGCQLITNFSVKVQVPLLGKMIEKRIIAEIEGNLPSLERLLEEHLSAHDVSSKPTHY